MVELKSSLSILLPHFSYNSQEASKRVFKNTIQLNFTGSVTVKAEIDLINNEKLQTL